MTSRPRHSVAALALGALLLVSCGAHPLPPSSASPLRNARLPELTRRTVSGYEIDAAALRGKPVLIEFFAKYCVPCQRTLAEAQRIHESGDAFVIGVALDELVSDVEWAIAHHRLSFPVIHDRGNVLSGRFRITELPHAFLANSSGVVRWVGGPEQPPGALDAALEAMAP